MRAVFLPKMYLLVPVHILNLILAKKDASKLQDYLMPPPRFYVGMYSECIVSMYAFEVSAVQCA